MTGSTERTEIVGDLGAAPATRPGALAWIRARVHRITSSADLAESSLDPRITAAFVVAAGILIAVLAEVTGQQFNWTLALVYGLLALGTAVPLGWAGIPGFGQGLFFAIGAYFMAFAANWGVPTPLLLLAAVLLSAAVGCVLSFIVTRLPFIAIAMLTLIVSQAAYQFAYTSHVTGGENGKYGIQRGTIFGVDLYNNDTFWWYAFVLTIIVVLILSFVRRSRWGRMMVATRQDPVRAAALGTNVRGARILSFTIGAAVCGLAGFIYAQLLGAVDPSIVTWSASAVAVVMGVIGGVRSLWGAIAGGIIYEWLNLSFSSSTHGVPTLWIGLALAVVVLVAPGGLAQLARGFVAAVIPGARTAPAKDES